MRYINLHLHYIYITRPFIQLFTLRDFLQNMVAAENGVGWGGHMGEVVPSRAFLVPPMRPQLTLRSVDFRSVHPITCFGGGCVPLG